MPSPSRSSQPRPEDASDYHSAFTRLEVVVGTSADGSTTAVVRWVTGTRVPAYRNSVILSEVRWPSMVTTPDQAAWCVRYALNEAWKDSATHPTA
jgi:hypothetical protein